MNLPPVPDDFGDMLAELVREGARFTVIGGYAVAFHGYQRATKDLDILIEPTHENAERVFRALVAFGAPLSQLQITAADLATPGQFVQLGVPPNRIDFLNQVPGITVEEALDGCEFFELDGLQIPVIGRVALLKNKRATGRPQDLLDVAALER